MSPEVPNNQNNVLLRSVERARRFGTAILTTALEPRVVVSDDFHFPGEGRHFEHREFPGFETAATDVDATAA